MYKQQWTSTGEDIYTPTADDLLSPAERILKEQRERFCHRGNQAEKRGDITLHDALFRIADVFRLAEDELYGKLCAIAANKDQ